MVKNGHVAISSRVTQLYVNGPGHVIESIRDMPRERIYNLSEREKKREREAEKGCAFLQNVHLLPETSVSKDNWIVQILLELLEFRNSLANKSNNVIWTQKLFSFITYLKAVTF